MAPSQPLFTFDQISSLIAGHVHAAAPLVAAASRFAGPQRCPVCGQSGHGPNECTFNCASCRLNFCPGARGKECVVIAKQFPAVVENALGRPLIDNLLKKLKQAHAKYNKLPAPSAASADASLLSSAVADDALQASNSASVWEGPSLHQH